MKQPGGDTHDDVSPMGLTEAVFAAAMRSACLGMALTDPHRPDNPLVFVNDAFCDLTGYPRDEVLGRNCRFLQGPDTDPAAVAQIHAALEAGRDISLELLNYRKDGAPFWNALHISPVRDPDGKIVHFFSTQVDVSEKKRGEQELVAHRAGLEQTVQARMRELQTALDQRTLFLNELDHRVKNNLQMISSLVMLQARRERDPQVREALDEIVSRLNALATVHRRLFQSDDPERFDLSEFVRDLVTDLAGGLRREDIDIRLELEPAQVVLSKAAPIALLVNEVVTNSLHHAFPDSRPGQVEIKIVKSTPGVRIEIRDDGVGMPDSGEPSGFGRMIVDLLSRQLQAQVTWQDAQPGVRVRVDLPGDGEKR